MQQSDWSRWLLGHAVGGTIGFIVGLPLGVVSAGLGVGVGIGLGIGFGQWRALKVVLALDPEQHPIGPLWIGSNTFGSILPGWLLTFAVVLGGSNGGVPVQDAGAYIGGVTAAATVFAGVAGALCGAAVGACQWLLLRRTARELPTRYGLAWLAATATGWGASWSIQGASAALLLTAVSAQPPSMPVLLMVGLAGLGGAWACAAALTGAVLSRMGRAGVISLA